MFGLMAVAGTQPMWNGGGGRIRWDIGNGPMSVGTGSAKNPGRGPAIIMGHGYTMEITVGFGFRELNGRLRGSHGVSRTTMLAGLPVGLAVWL